MKYTLLTVILFASVLVACESSLDLSPKGYVASSTYYKNATDAEAAVIGAYSALRVIYRAEHILTPNELCSDGGIPFLTGGADRIAIWNYSHTSSNTFPGQIWSSAYQGIQFSNIVIDRVPAISMDEGLKNQYIAEAQFLRALHYFNLVRFFGDVPIVTKETTSLADVEVERSPIADVYELIETDLKQAELVLPPDYEGDDIGRATAGAAKGLLAKVYLTRAGNDASSPYWALAAAKAKEVIDLGRYDLWEDYADVFKLENRGGKESLFEIQYITDIQGNQFTTGWAPRGAPIVPSNGFGIFRVTKSLFESYTEDDERKATTFLTSYVDPNTQQTVHLSIDTPDPALAVSFWKLADPTVKVGQNGGTSWPYLRYSEILLIYAEALNEANNGPNSLAFDAINKVRQRAGVSLLEGLTKEQFKDAVLHERRLELCFEGHRWFDLVRTGRLLDAVKNENSFGRNATIENYHKLFPIPLREMDANQHLIQNNGY